MNERDRNVYAQLDTAFGSQSLLDLRVDFLTMTRVLNMTSYDTTFLNVEKYFVGRILIVRDRFERLDEIETSGYCDSTREGHSITVSGDVSHEQMTSRTVSDRSHRCLGIVSLNIFYDRFQISGLTEITSPIRPHCSSPSSSMTLSTHALYVPVFGGGIIV
jgi:hypothetical protein